MKKLIFFIFIVILFTNFVFAQSGADLSDRFKMQGTHIDKNGIAIDTGVRPSSVVLKNPLVAEPKTFGPVFVIIVGILCLGIGFFLGRVTSDLNYIKFRNSTLPNSGRESK